MQNIALALADGEPIELGANRRPEGINGPGSGLAQQRLQLRKDLLDRVVVGAVRG